MNTRRVLCAAALSFLIVAAASADVWAASDAYGPPVVTRTVSPSYPSDPAIAGARGSVTMMVLVRSDGSLGPATILESHPAELGFEASARDAVRKWQFHPALESGEPVDAYALIQVDLEQNPRATRRRSKSAQWSYVSSGTGGRFDQPDWDRLSRWQRQWQWAGVFGPWPFADREFAGDHPQGAFPQRADSLIGPTEPSMDYVPPTQERQLGRRQAGGYSSSQIVGTPHTTTSRPFSTRTTYRQTTSPPRRVTTSTTRSRPTAKTRTTRATKK